MLYEPKDISLRKRTTRISRHCQQSYNFLPDERVLLNYTCIMSYVAGPPRDTILRKALPDGKILFLSLVRYRIPVIAHVDKASAANRGPLSRLSSSANSSPANQRLTTAPRSSSSNNIGAFRTRLRPCRTPTCGSLSRRLRARLSEIAKLHHFWHIMLKTMLKDIDFAKGSWILWIMHISKLILNPIESE